MRLKSLFNRTISNRILFTYTFLVILPLIIIVLITNNQITKLSREEFQKYSFETVQQISYSIGNYLEQMETLSYSAVIDEEVQEFLKTPMDGSELLKIHNLEALKASLNKRLFYIYPNNMFSMVIIGYNKELYYSRDYGLIQDYDWLNNPYINSLMASSEPLIYVSSHTREYVFDDHVVFSIIRKINDIQTNRSLGYLYFDIRYESFDTLINNVSVSEDSELLIVDGSKVIYSKNDEGIFQEIETPLFQTINEGSEGGGFITLKGNEHFYTYTTIDNTDWKIISLHSMKAYNEKAISITRFIIIISSMILVLSIIIGFFISDAITKPLKELSNVMGHIENENFDIRVKTKGEDEVAVLGKVFNQMVERIRDLVQNVYKAQLAEKDAAIYALQSQINPHFLYNTLQSIADIADYEDVHEITDMCGSLSSMFRYSIENERRFVRLYDEVQHIDNYISLQSIRYGDQIKFDIRIPETYLNIRVPRFILQPIVENAIIHGISPKGFKGRVMIHADKSQESLRITVEDDGVGMDDNKLAGLIQSIDEAANNPTLLSANHLALKNVNNRMNLYYGPNHSLLIQSEANVGTKVTISIPIDGYVERSSFNV